MRTWMLVASSLLVLAACGKSGEAQNAPGATAAATANSQSASASASSAGGVAIAETENHSRFAYAYPAAAAAIPKLKAALEADANNERQDLRMAAQSASGDAEYYSETEWKVVTDLPRWLSLSRESTQFTGQAQPNNTADALVWDREADKDLKSTDLFVSGDALDTAMRNALVHDLNRQLRAKWQQDKPAGASSEPSDEYVVSGVNASEFVVILGSSNHTTFDRIGVRFPAGIIGPVTDGYISDATLPVTPAIIAAVKPEYRRYFSVGR